MNWRRYLSVKESLKRQAEAERKAVEGVCDTCGARTVDHRCVLCGRTQ